jgi:predicted Zn-ribbon and HTH transcriptional regulator
MGRELKFCPKCKSTNIIVTGGDAPQDTCQDCGFNDWKTSALTPMQFPTKQKITKKK